MRPTPAAHVNEHVLYPHSVGCETQRFFILVVYIRLQIFHCRHRSASFWCRQRNSLVMKVGGTNVFCSAQFPCGLQYSVKETARTYLYLLVLLTPIHVPWSISRNACSFRCGLRALVDDSKSQEHLSLLTASVHPSIHPSVTATDLTDRWNHL